MLEGDVLRHAGPGPLAHPPEAFPVSEYGFESRLGGQDFPSGYPAVHDYGDADLGNTVTIPNGCSVDVTLQWNNPWGAALATSVDEKSGTQNPFESTSWTAPDLGPDGFDFTYGAGRVDAANAINFSPSAVHRPRRQRHPLLGRANLGLGLGRCEPSW